jgi:hypothetical protein
VIRVVHINTPPERNAYRVYIGRKFRRHEASPLGNPHKLKRGGDREAAIEGFRHTLFNAFQSCGSASQTREQADMVREVMRLAELEAKRTEFGHHAVIELACWCAPETCHGDVIADYVRNIIAARQKAGAK